MSIHASAFSLSGSRRHRAHPAPGPRDIRCAHCGASRFDVEADITITFPVMRRLACRCGRASDGIAAIVHARTVSTSRDVGRLRADYRVQWDERDIPEHSETVIDAYDVACLACVRRAGAGDWQPRHGAIGEEVEVIVECAECLHEVEFGWSAPERQGRIVPVASASFTPCAVWPEPRFRDTWARRGWLH